MQLNFSRRTRLYLGFVATLLTLASLLFAFGSGWRYVFAPDTGWILKAGEYILNAAALPKTDIFSWTVRQQPWVLYQWLFEAIAAGFLKAGHLWFAGLAAYATAGFILLFILPRRWLLLGVPLWVTFGMLTLTINQVWFVLRPQLVSFLALFAFLTILEKYRRGATKKWLWVLPPLMVLWTNLHSFWFIGLLAVLCYALAAGRSSRQLWIAFAFCCLAVFMNPYGTGIITYNLRFINDVSQDLNELHSPFFFKEMQCYTFVAYLAISWLIMLTRIRKVPSAGLMFSLVASVAALRYARFMPIAVLATWPYVGLALAAKQQKAQSAFRHPAVVVGHLALALAIPAALWARAVPDQHAAAVLFTARQLDGINFLAQHHVPDERLYNDERLGSRLLFFGVSPVFIDTRFDMYGKGFHHNWLVAYYGDPGWKEYLARYHVNAILLSETEEIRKQLMSDPGWLLVYDDGIVNYWISNTPEHQQLMQRWRMTPVTIALSGLPQQTIQRTLAAKAMKHHDTGMALLNAGYVVECIPEFRDAVFASPRSADFHHWYIHALAVSGRSDELAVELKRARRFFWCFPDESVTDPIADIHQTPEQRARVATWVIQSTNQLIEKYKHGQSQPAVMRAETP